jgi:hypothetical protein
LISEEEEKEPEEEEKDEKKGRKVANFVIRGGGRGSGGYKRGGKTIQTAKITGIKHHLII